MYEICYTLTVSYYSVLTVEIGRGGETRIIEKCANPKHTVFHEK